MSMDGLPYYQIFGMGGVGLGNLPPDPPKICSICGDKAMSCNFGCITCESCKAFFRRNAHRDNVKGRCDGRCSITVETRSYCKSCRLEKCFRMGMKKELILSDEQRAERKRKIQQNREKKKNTEESGACNTPSAKSDEHVSKRKPASPIHPFPALINHAQLVSKDLLDSLKIPRLEGKDTFRQPVTDIIDGKDIRLDGFQELPSLRQTLPFDITLPRQTQPTQKQCTKKDNRTLCDILSTSSDSETEARAQDEVFSSCSDDASKSSESVFLQSSQSPFDVNNISAGTESESLPQQGLRRLLCTDIDNNLASFQILVSQPTVHEATPVSQTVHLATPISQATMHEPTPVRYGVPPITMDLLQIDGSNTDSVQTPVLPSDNVGNIPIIVPSSSDIDDIQNNVPPTPAISQAQSANDLEGMLPLLLSAGLSQGAVDIQGLLPLLFNSGIPHGIQNDLLGLLPSLCSSGLTKEAIGAIQNIVSSVATTGLTQDSLISILDVIRSLPNRSSPSGMTPQYDITTEIPLNAQANPQATVGMRPSQSKFVNTLLGDGAAPIPDTTPHPQAPSKTHSPRGKDVVVKHPPPAYSTAYAYEYISCVSKEVSDQMEPEARVLISELAEAFSGAFDIYVEEGFSGEPTYVECFNYCEFYVKCVVRMVSKMNAFTSFCTDDQINLLKNSIVEIFILHSVRAFDVLQEGFYIRQKEGFHFLSIEALRTLPQGSTLVKGYTQFALEVLRKTRNDGPILMCLVVMWLFRTREEDKLKYKDQARVERCYKLYMWTLCNYMNVKHPDKKVTIEKTMEICVLIEKLCVDFVQALCQCTVDDLSPLLSEMLEITQSKK